jgi:polyadenylate-binding protein
MSVPVSGTPQVPNTGSNLAPVSSIPQTPAQSQASNLPSGHASLYVGDLEDEVTEAMIFEKFSPIGSIISIRVCRDMISRKSLGYAYVNFSTAAEAEKAIDELNFDVLRNKQMRIMWSQRDPSLRKSGVGNLFIKNLDKDIVVRDLYDTFSTLGDILSCKIPVDEKGVSKGYGFVHFASKEAAENAISRLNGALLKGKKIFVGHFIPRNQRANQGGGDRVFNNLFIKNFGKDMDNARLKQMFEEFGEITSVKVEIDDNGMSKGFGFVCFKDSESAIEAVQAKHQSEHNGQQIYVARAMKKSERQDHLRAALERKKADKITRYATGVNLYVKNLEDSIDDEALRKEFSSHGNITSVKVMRDQTGRSKGFGFVCFTYPDEATKAVTEMNGKLVGGKPLYVALAQRKEERRILLESQTYQRQLALRGISGMPQVNALPQPVAANFPASMNTQGYPGAPAQPINFFMANQAQAFAGHPGLFTGMPNRNFPQPMAMGARGGSWNPRAGPQGPMRPTMSGYPQSMIRSQNPQTQPGQQQRFPSANPVRTPQGNTLPQQTQQPQMNVSRMPNGSVPNRIPSQGQVLITTAARNIQPQPMSNVNMPGAPRLSQPVQMPSNMNTGLPPPSNQQATESLDQFMNLVTGMASDDQKQFLGERLYAIIAQWHPEFVGKLTGMLLEIDNRELISMIMENQKTNPNEISNLRKKVDSALAVLQQKNEGAPQKV